MARMVLGKKFRCIRPLLSIKILFVISLLGYMNASSHHEEQTYRPFTKLQQSPWVLSDEQCARLRFLTYQICSQRENPGFISSSTWMPGREKDRIHNSHMEELLWVSFWNLTVKALTGMKIEHLSLILKVHRICELLKISICLTKISFNR